MIATHTIKHNGVLYMPGQEIPVDGPKVIEPVQDEKPEAVKRGRTRKAKVENEE